MVAVIMGIGSDLVEIGRVKEGWERTGDRFLRKALTPRELEYCHGFRDPWPHLAARFAAKESVMKALGSFVDPLDIEVDRDPKGGPPQVILKGSAEVITRKKGIRKVIISLSHTRKVAHAQAVALG